MEVFQILSNLSLLFSIGGFNGGGMYGSSNISGFSIWSTSGCAFRGLRFRFLVAVFIRWEILLDHSQLITLAHLSFHMFFLNNCINLIKILVQIFLTLIVGRLSIFLILSNVNISNFNSRTALIRPLNCGEEDVLTMRRYKHCCWEVKSISFKKVSHNVVM